MADNANIPTATVAKRTIPSSGSKKDNVIIALVSINIIFLIIFIILFSRSEKGDSLRGLSPDVIRETGNKLKAVGLNEKAAGLYQTYLATEELDPKAKANISFSLADMLIKDANYEEALKWLYTVESLDKNFSNKEELNRNIVMCLEKLGKGSAAEYALSTRSQFGKDATETDKVGDVVAIIGDKKVTLNEIASAIDRLPEWAKSNYSKPEAKLEFAKKFIADELLFKKGIKLNYDKDDKVKRQIEDISKSLVVEKVIEKEIKEKISVQEDDLKNYFAANKDKYGEPERAKISVIKTSSEDDAKKALKEIKAGADFEKAAKKYSIDTASKEKGGQIDYPATKGVKGVPGVGMSDEVSKAVFSAKSGGVTEVLKVDNNYFIVKVNELIPQKPAVFEQAKDRVQSDYYSQKFNSAYQEMIENILTSTEVKFFPEKIK